MASEVVFEIVHYKVAGDVLFGGKARRVVAVVDGLYQNALIKSSEDALYVGSQYAVPWRDTLKAVRFHTFLIDGLLTTDIGYAKYEISEDSSFNPFAAIPHRVKLDIVQKGSTERVGAIVCKVWVQDLFARGRGDYSDATARPAGTTAENRSEMQQALPDFRFKILNKAVNWQRLKSISVDRVIQTNDCDTVLSCLEDVSRGDVSQEEVDPRLHHTLKLAQYSSQYLLSCRKALKDRAALIESAVDTFTKEEDLLDLKIAKMRARENALQRESADLDKLANDYTSVLRTLNPKLFDQLYRTYRARVQREDSLAEEAKSKQLRNQQNTRASRNPSRGERDAHDLNSSEAEDDDTQLYEKRDGVLRSERKSSKRFNTHRSQRGKHSDYSSENARESKGSAGRRGDGYREKYDRRHYSENRDRDRGSSGRSDRARDRAREDDHRGSHYPAGTSRYRDDDGHWGDSSGDNHYRGKPTGRRERERYNDRYTNRGGSGDDRYSDRGSGYGDRSRNDHARRVQRRDSNASANSWESEQGKKHYPHSGGIQSSQRGGASQHGSRDGWSTAAADEDASANAGGDGGGQYQQRPIYTGRSHTLSGSRDSRDGGGRGGYREDDHYHDDERGSRAGFAERGSIRPPSASGSRKGPVLDALGRPMRASASSNLADGQSASVDSAKSSISVDHRAKADDEKDNERDEGVPNFQQGSGFFWARPAGALGGGGLPQQESTGVLSSTAFSVDSLAPLTATAQSLKQPTILSTATPQESNQDALGPTQQPSRRGEKYLSVSDEEIEYEDEERDRLGGLERSMDRGKEGKGRDASETGANNSAISDDLATQHLDDSSRRDAAYDTSFDDSRQYDEAPATPTANISGPISSSQPSSLITITTQNQKPQQKVPALSATLPASYRTSSPFLATIGEVATQEDVYEQRRPGFSSGPSHRTMDSVPVGLSRVARADKRKSSYDEEDDDPFSPDPRTATRNTIGSGNNNSANSNELYLSWGAGQSAGQSHNSGKSGHSAVEDSGVIGGGYEEESFESGGLTAAIDTSQSVAVEFNFPGTNDTNNTKFSRGTGATSSTRKLGKGADAGGMGRGSSLYSDSMYSSTNATTSLEGEKVYDSSGISNTDFGASSDSTGDGADLLREDNAAATGNAPPRLLQPGKSVRHAGQDSGGRSTALKEGREGEGTGGDISYRDQTSEYTQSFNDTASSASPFDGNFTGRSQQGDTEDDFVLLGTSKFSSTTGGGEGMGSTGRVGGGGGVGGRDAYGASSFFDPSEMAISEEGLPRGLGAESDLGSTRGTDALERDSLGSEAFEARQRDPGATMGPISRSDDAEERGLDARVDVKGPLDTIQSAFSPVIEGLKQQQQQQQLHQHQQRKPQHSGLTPILKMPSAGGAAAAALQSTEPPAAAGDADADASAEGLHWASGRAGMDSIELAEAFDVYVSAIHLVDEFWTGDPKVRIGLDFLGVASNLSNEILITTAVQPVNFAAHMVFDATGLGLLESEIQDLGEAVAFQINVFALNDDGAVEEDAFGVANVELWIMVEDSTNILRQEVELMSADLDNVIGSVVVDVRGYRLLRKCA